MILGGSSHLLSSLDPWILDIQHSYGRWPMKIETLHDDLTIFDYLTYPKMVKNGKNHLPNTVYPWIYKCHKSVKSTYSWGNNPTKNGMNEVGTQLVFGYPVSKSRLMRCQPLETWKTNHRRMKHLYESVN